MRFTFRINKRDVLASGLLCLFGLAGVLQVSAYSLGRTSGMATLGFFPVLAGALLMLVGILWLFDSRLSPDEDEGVDIGVSKWRGCCGVVSGAFAFMLLCKYGGLAPALFALVFISALGDRTHSWRSALLLSSFATAAGVLVLSWGLDLPFPPFRWG